MGHLLQFHEDFSRWFKKFPHLEMQCPVFNSIKHALKSGKLQLHVTDEEDDKPSRLMQGVNLHVDMTKLTFLDLAIWYNYSDYTKPVHDYTGTRAMIENIWVEISRLTSLKVSNMNHSYRLRGKYHNSVPRGMTAFLTSFPNLIELNTSYFPPNEIVVSTVLESLTLNLTSEGEDEVERCFLLLKNYRDTLKRLALFSYERGTYGPCDLLKMITATQTNFPILTNRSLPPTTAKNQKKYKSKKKVKLQRRERQENKLLGRSHYVTTGRDEFFAYLKLQRKSTLESASVDATDSVSKELPLGRDEEEAQDAFTAEFRKMKIRGKFPCKLCMEVFGNLRELKDHNRVHLDAAGSGPYSCNICPFSIHDEAALTRHMLTHNDDKPFECSHRNCALTTKGKCTQRHLRNRHGKTTRDEVKRTIIHHASEDSSCDDPVKKMKIYNATYDNDDVVTNERHSPLANLKDIASAETMKTHVKSLDQLTKPTIEEMEREKAVNSFVSHQRPIDLSMDVLDLSRDEEEEEGITSKIDLEKNQHVSKTQQQLASEHLSNGVLMPKEKQRRYRTERPFACEHCASRFTLRSNMERHIKQKHPEYWAQRQRNTRLRRGSGSNNSGQNIIPPEHPPQLPSQSIASNPLSSIEDVPEPSASDLSVEESIRESTEFIGRLLEVSNPETLDRLFKSSPEEAAKLLGVEM
ncbi:Ras-responsive element-binding protein 1 [Pseudolycoriella hygida]|uniref:Ras-responsive element-binding protein 1 n=1 Tax=Pseudolycoriella hygida TaxID=35572 RepID=A0A9Q0S4M2_9DIPT|nr:Ras-responsive element-binding protein 1 [Pseudolycoriella hygida]